MNLTITNGVTLQIGRGVYRFRLEFSGRRWWLLRVPFFLGKAWNFGDREATYQRWASVVAEGPHGSD